MMKDSISITKPALNSSEKRIIEMVVDSLASENSFQENE
jgi:hypothetical protein